MVGTLRSLAAIRFSGSGVATLVPKGFPFGKAATWFCQTMELKIYTDRGQRILPGAELIRAKA